MLRPVFFIFSKFINDEEDKFQLKLFFRIKKDFLQPYHFSFLIR